MKKRFLQFIAFTLIVAMFAPGCATLFGSTKAQVYTSSDPNGADVYVNGVRMGTTPFTLNLAKNQEYMLEFKKDGYKTIGQKINSKVGAGWVILDVLGGLVPVVIDAATGNWKKLDQDQVNAVLEKENK
jgi:hypothetical protein